MQNNQLHPILPTIVEHWPKRGSR